MVTLTWGIIGLGWLGTSLRDHLIAHGHAAWGTHRHNFNFESDRLPTSAADVLFLNTPPLITIEPAVFVAKVVTSTAPRILFVSSTSVYGANLGRVTEADDPKPVTASARWLRAVEQGLSAGLGSRLTIIRPGGLIGGRRHPVFTLSERGTMIPDGPINFVHRDDLVRAIVLVAQREDVPLVNVVSPHHPEKSSYYAAWTNQLNLPDVRVEPTHPLDPRIVDSTVLPRLHFEWTQEHLDQI